jgi:hypothetical protein
MADEREDSRPGAAAEGMARTRWTFLSNHAHVMISIARDNSVRVRDLAGRVGITERAVQRIITELESDGYLSHVRVGRRNLYTIHRDRPLRHAVESGTTVGDLLRLLTGS